MTTFKIDGMKELRASINRLGKLPQTYVTQAARVGTSIALRTARSEAPENTGALKAALYLKGEKSKLKPKKVYQVAIKSNPVFVKNVKNPVYGKKRAYYPASQEYGFSTKNGRYIPGFGFLRKSIESNKAAIETKMVSKLASRVEKELKK